MSDDNTRLLPVSIFYSYSDVDWEFRQKLEIHLSSLQRQGFISTWHHDLVAPGMERDAAINHYLNSASLILLLISPEFFASDSCYNVQMQRALAKQKAGSALVIPILLRPVEWKQTPLGTLQALPRDGRPITNWENPDAAFMQIATEIRLVVEALRDPVVLVSSLPSQSWTQRLTDDLTTHGIVLWEETNPSNLKDRIQQASAVSNNTAHSSDGGGIFNKDNGGYDAADATFTFCTIVNNSASLIPKAI